MIATQQCCVKVYPKERWGSFHPHPCAFKAKVEADGKWYCGVHYPAKVKAKDAARAAARVAEAEISRKHYEGIVEKNRRANAYPKLIEALREAMHGVKSAEQCRAIQALLVELGEIK